MKRARLVPIALGLCAGIACDVCGIGSAAWGAGAVLACLVGTRAAVVRSSVTAALAAFAFGMADAELFAHSPPSSDDPHTKVSAATVVERLPATQAGDDANGFELHLADGRTVIAYLRDSLSVGERIAIRGRVFAFAGPRNPGEPSTAELERERGVDGRLAHAAVLRCDGVDPFDATLWLARLRDAASQRTHATLPEPDASILAGALWGERGALPRELRDEFQETGTVHILVTAGLHLGVVAWIGLALLRGAGAGRITASLATIALVWAYAAFSGAHLPSVRAATMLTFALLARATGREAYMPNALAAAAIVIALARPLSVASISFALSFSCVISIALFARRFAHAFEGIGAPAFASEALALTFATQLGTWPLTASAFLVVAPYAPLANALVVPVVGVAMLTGAAELLASPIPPLASALAGVERALLDWIVGVVRFVASLPFARVAVTPPPMWAIVLYDLALLAFAISMTRRRIAAGALLVTLASLLCLFPPALPQRTLRITAIDVGQADALLVQTPAGHAFLIDGGGRLERGASSAGDSEAEEVGERIVVPFLLRSGVHRLDAILLSHPHGDHAGGLPAVLRTIRVDAFADSGQDYPGHAYHDALEVAREERVPMLEPRGGDVWQTDDGVTFRFYGPTSPLITGSRSDINSNSLVFRLQYGRFRMLFMGDAGRETEERLLAHRDDLRADVLKVGHHGSAYGTTTEFLHAAAPRDAIISVGRNNLFGHPAPATIDALRDAGVATYRTDRDGAVTIESDGARFTASSYLSPSDTTTRTLAP